MSNDNAPLAQPEEAPGSNPGSVGSNPAGGTNDDRSDGHYHWTGNWIPSGGLRPGRVIPVDGPTNGEIWKDRVSLVTDFHRKYNCEIGEAPTIPSLRECTLRYNLMNEELAEYWRAVINGDMEEVADAIGDLLYVVYGTAIAHGLHYQLDAIFREIHASNMTKNGDQRADGKITKGLAFRPPNIKKYLEV